MHFSGEMKEMIIRRKTRSAHELISPIIHLHIYREREREREHFLYLKGTGLLHLYLYKFFLLLLYRKEEDLNKNLI